VIQERKRQLASDSMGLKMNKSVKSVFFQICSVPKCIFFFCEDHTNLNICEKAQSPNLFNCLSMITHSKRRSAVFITSNGTSRKIALVLTSITCYLFKIWRCVFLFRDKIVEITNCCEKFPAYFSCNFRNYPLTREN
jgi:hypothetical protein